MTTITMQDAKAAVSAIAANPSLPAGMRLCASIWECDVADKGFTLGLAKAASDLMSAADEYLCISNEMVH